MSHQDQPPPGTQRSRRPQRIKLKVPAVLASALKKNKKAQAAFDRFPPSHKREYIKWITEAKGDDTRARRVTKAIEQMAKSRNWKYER